MIHEREPKVRQKESNVSEKSHKINAFTLQNNEMWNCYNIKIQKRRIKIDYGGKGPLTVTSCKEAKKQF